MTREGTVALYFRAKRYGFVDVPGEAGLDGVRYFFHANDFDGDEAEIKLGGTLRFRGLDTDRGPKAVDIEVVEAGDADEG